MLVLATGAKRRTTCSSTGETYATNLSLMPSRPRLSSLRPCTDGWLVVGPAGEPGCAQVEHAIWPIAGFADLAPAEPAGLTEHRVIGAAGALRPRLALGFLRRRLRAGAPAERAAELLSKPLGGLTLQALSADPRVAAVRADPPAPPPPPPPGAGGRRRRVCLEAPPLVEAPPPPLLEPAGGHALRGVVAEARPRDRPRPGEK